MKQRILAFLLLTAMVVCCASPAALSEAQNDGKTQVVAGTLSFLNIAEEEYAIVLNGKYGAIDFMKDQGTVDDGVGESDALYSDLEGTVRYYDSLDALIMALEAGQVKWIELPMYTVIYLCIHNDKVTTMTINTEDNLSSEMQSIVDRFTCGFSFMMLEKNAALRDDFNRVIGEMRADGTMDQLTMQYIAGGLMNDEQSVVDFDNKYDEKIVVAVTGDLPPMDYVSASGQPAGFNTAVLSEIGKRLGKNIELVQTDSVGRSTALASGVADAVFWTRVSVQASDVTTEETESILAGLDAITQTNLDIPEDTIVTDPYFVDYLIPVWMK